MKGKKRAVRMKMSCTPLMGSRNDNRSEMLTLSNLQHFKTRDPQRIVITDLVPDDYSRSWTARFKITKRREVT